MSRDSGLRYNHRRWIRQKSLSFMMVSPAKRGGEKVLEVLAEIFPEAPIFTLFHLKGSQAEILEKRDIRTSFLQKFPFLEKKYRFYLPLFPPGRRAL